MKHSLSSSPSILHQLWKSTHHSMRSTLKSSTRSNEDPICDGWQPHRYTNASILSVVGRKLLMHESITHERSRNGCMVVWMALSLPGSFHLWCALLRTSILWPFSFQPLFDSSNAIVWGRYHHFTLEKRLIENKVGRTAWTERDKPSAPGEESLHHKGEI